MTPQQLDMRIEDFLHQYHQGVAAWVKAGDILVELYKADKTIFKKILSRNSSISLELLNLLYGVGMRTVHPLAISVAMSRIGEALLVMPFEAQKEACEVPLPVVRSTGVSHKVVTLRTSQMTPDDATLVFGPKGIRTPEEQVQLLTEREKTVRSAPVTTVKSHSRVVKPKPLARYEVRRLGKGRFEWVPTTKNMQPGNQVVRLSNGSAIVELVEE